MAKIMAKKKKKKKIITNFLMFLIKETVGPDGQYCNLIYSKIFSLLDLLLSSKIQCTKNEVFH